MKNPKLLQARAYYLEKMRIRGAAKTAALKANMLAGSSLRELRMSLGLTLEQMNEKLGGRMRAADLEAGKQQVTPEILELYQRMLDTQ